MQKLPAVVKARAAGGVAQPNPAIADVVTSLVSSPEDTFGVLRDLLQGLENRLSYVRRDVERREALAAADAVDLAGARLADRAPSAAAAIRSRGEPGFHQGIDISTEKGQPVFATADGTVESAGYTGDYGNLIVARHGFGLTTRYGHLSAFAVKPGQQRQARRRHRLRRIDRPLDRRAPALRDSRQRQADQPAAAADAAGRADRSP